MQENKLTTLQSRAEDQLNNALTMTDRFVSRHYLSGLSEQDIIPFDRSVINPNGIRLFKIEKLIFDKDENVNDKLISVYSALQDVDSSAFMLLDADTEGVSFYIGVYSYRNASVAGDILKKSLEGNFPGSEISKGYTNSEIRQLMDGIVRQPNDSGSCKSVSSVTIVPSGRDDDKEKFVQGVEKLIDTMRGETYTMMVIARNVGKIEIESVKRGYEELFSTLSPFNKVSLSFGENSSDSVTEGVFTNFSKSVNSSISKTVGENRGVSHSDSYGWNSGGSFMFIGTGHNWGRSSGSSNATSYGSSRGTSTTEGESTVDGSGSSRQKTLTMGETKTITIEDHNKYVAGLLKRIEENLDRIKDCEAYGLWDCAVYFIADDIQTSVVAANAFKALMSGENTSVQNSFLNAWSIENADKARSILQYLEFAQHPRVMIRPETGFDERIVSPGNYISGKELTLLMGVPHKSVTGITVNSMAEFGRNVYTQSGKKQSDAIKIGHIRHMGKTECTEVKINLKALSSHCFITGSTGCGKSNTTFCILEKLVEKGIPFLVIEPAKGEDKDAFAGLEGLNVFSTNPLIAQMLKINPFRFDPRIHVLEHIDRLIDVFNTCWEMYAAMPALLKDAVEKAYIKKGWDLLNSIYLRAGLPEYPTFDDLLVSLTEVIGSSAYSSESKGDYTGALVTRVASLANGISGQIFCDIYDIPDNVLFDQNTIIDLSRVGSSETKALIMGLLVLKLSEYRMADALGANRGLRHVTVMEEAHNLLKRVKVESGGSSVISKSVEMLSNSIAEMRTYGEGFIIVDQSPGAVDISAVKNTNTKIVMRLPNQEDCSEMGNALSLEDNQIREISKLGTGEAVIMQNNWVEAVLARIDLAEEKYKTDSKVCSYSDITTCRGVIIKELMDQYLVTKHMNHDRMSSIIESLIINDHKKKEFKLCIECIEKHLDIGRDLDYFCEALLRISGTKDLFEAIKPSIIESGLQSDSNKLEEGTYSNRALKVWYAELKDLLKNYVTMPDNYIEMLSKHLIYALQLKKTDVDYAYTYDQLF